VDGRANTSELSINVVRYERPKMLPGRSQKWQRSGKGVLNSSLMGPVFDRHAVGGKREPKPILSLERNVVSP